MKYSYLTLFFIFTNSAFAGDIPASTNRARLETLSNKKFQDTNEITDSKLRADSGSRSRYSLIFNLTYAGPTLGDLSSKDQPNPDGSIGSYSTSLGGTLGTRLRLNNKKVFSLSTGAKTIHPFHGAQRVDLSNPSLTFDNSSRWQDIQMRSSVSFIYRTIPEFRMVGQFGYLLLSQSMVHDWGATGAAIGADLSLGSFMYSRSYRDSDKKAPQYALEINPTVKYRFSEKLDLSSSLTLGFWNPRSRQDHLVLLNRAMTQRLALGYSLNHSTYIQPYLGFYPQNLQADLITLNLKTIFSAF